MIKGPDRYISQPIRVFGMDAYSAVGIVPVVLFPFAMWSWITALVVFAFIFVAGCFRLPSYQLFRFLRVKMSEKTLMPYAAQKYRARRGVRPWPY